MLVARSNAEAAAKPKVIDFIVKPPPIVAIPTYMRRAINEFKIGQYVYYRSRAEGRFVAMRLLPQSKGEPRYIIRSEDEPEREYTAKASELRRAWGGR